MTSAPASAQFVCMTIGVIPELEAMIESTGGVSVSKQLHLEVATFRSVLRMRASKRTRRIRRHGPRRRANLSAFAAPWNGSASPTRFSRALNALPTRLALRRYLAFKSREEGQQEEKGDESPCRSRARPSARRLIGTPTRASDHGSGDAQEPAAVVVDCSMHQAPRSHLFPYAVKM